MCYLYNVTTTRDAALQFTKAFRDRAGRNEASFDVYTGYQAPIGPGEKTSVVMLPWPTLPGTSATAQRARSACRSAGMSERRREPIHGMPLMNEGGSEYSPPFL